MLTLTLKEGDSVYVTHSGQVLRVIMRPDGKTSFAGPRDFVIERSKVYLAKLAENLQTKGYAA